MPSPTPPVPPANSPGADLREAAAGPTVTNHGNQEVELRIESLDHMGSNLDLDPSALERGYKYRWVYRAPVKVARAKARGYRIVDPKSHKKIKNFVGDVLPIAEDGTVTVGDVILMRIPISVHKARRKELRKTNKARLEGPERQFRKKAREASKQARLSQTVKVITDEDEK